MDDGVIVFPKEGKERKASAEGTFERTATGDAHEAEHAKETMKQTGMTEAPKYRSRPRAPSSTDAGGFLTAEARLKRCQARKTTRKSRPPH